MNLPNASQEPIRTAVVGFGLAGRVFHCPFVSAVPGLELRTIVQRRGEEAGAAYPRVHIARGIDEVLGDPEIDLVIIGTPNETHFQLAERVLSSGKHCVIDKPFAATGQEALKLVQLTKKTGKLVVPFHNRRFDGDFRTLKALLADGTLGRVVEINSHFDRFRPSPRTESWKEAAGPMSGLLFDLGSHLIDQALALFGAPDAVTASVYRDREGTDIDDGFEVVLDYNAGGMRFRCGSSLIAAEAAPRYRVNGTRGSYVKYGVDPQEALVGSGTKPPVLGTGADWLLEPEAAWGTLTLAELENERPTVRQFPHPTMAGDYRLFYENVRDAIHGGAAKLAIKPEDGYRCIRMIELALQSTRERRTIPVTL